MIGLDKIRRSFFVALWFVFLTFPLMVIRVNTIYDTVEWRWHNMAFIGAGSFLLSLLWTYLLERRNRALRRQRRGATDTQDEKLKISDRVRDFFGVTKNRRVSIAVLLFLVLIYPFVTSMYQTNIMISALVYVVLGLGLNIIIGLGGMLHLGYIAFYAVGAYSYALLNIHFGLSFWLALPVGAALGALFGILVGIPVLRLHGDYLAIVTLAFAEIVRLVLENWAEFTGGPSGIANIPRPNLFGIDFKLQETTILVYFVVVVLLVITVVVVNRLENSRIGRQWEAMKEDYIATQAMGINTAKTKLAALSIGGLWAGLMGVVFAGRTTFINPASFTVWESVIVLCTVVLGGMGSIPGVVVGALILILLPEYMRAFQDYRLLIFGAVLVTMMIFRPGGIIQKRRRAYTFRGESG